MKLEGVSVWGNVNVLLKESSSLCLPLGLLEKKEEHLAKEERQPICAVLMLSLCLGVIAVSGIKIFCVIRPVIYNVVDWVFAAVG